MTKAKYVMTAEEIAAAKLEGLAPATALQWLKIKRARQLARVIERAETELKTIKSELATEMRTEGLQGLLYHGDKVVNRTDVTATRFDVKKFREQNAEVAVLYTVPNIYETVSIK